MRTFYPNGKEATALSQGPWHLVDASGQVLGRLATRVARLLTGKHKVRFTPSVDCGDHVVIINANKVRLTGRKLDQKVYYHHSGYPGGLKAVTARQRMEQNPAEMVRDAILGMVPKNKLHARRAKKLRIFAGEQHPHAAQQPQPLTMKR